MARAPYRIHVNRHVMDANRRNGANDAPLTMFRGQERARAHTIEILDAAGNVVGRLVHRPDKPLKCGAKVWVEALNARVVEESCGDARTVACDPEASR